MSQSVQAHIGGWKNCDLTDQLFERKNRWTPDYLKLKLEKYIPVFVYGTLKAGMPRHGVLEETVALGDGYTSTAGYQMVKSTRGDFPVVLGQNTVGVLGQRILGEVYLVSPKHMLNLDKIEDNNTMYKREARYVYLLDQTMKTANGVIRPSIKCWIYLGVHDFWKNQDTETMKSKEVDGGKMRVYEWEREPSWDSALKGWEKDSSGIWRNASYGP